MYEQDSVRTLPFEAVWRLDCKVDKMQEPSQGGCSGTSLRRWGPGFLEWLCWGEEKSLGSGDISEVGSQALVTNQM